MRLIKPSYKILHVTPDSPQRIERAGRVCYKSEEGINESSSQKFCKMLYQRGHHSVLEHCIATVHFTVDRGFTHELVRHRVASFSQECLVGNTLIAKHLTIQQLYKNFHKIKNKDFYIRSVDANNKVFLNKVIDVWNKGYAKVYHIITNKGYYIETTENHKFLTSSGYTTLSQLTVGDKVYVNGRPCLVKVNDFELERLYDEENLNPTEIANRLNCPYRSVIDKLHRMGKFIKHKNDKCKIKYNKNHTLESFEKMKETIKDQYRCGRTVWNKGLKEGDCDGVNRQADSLRKHHHNSEQGENNPSWRGGISQGIGHRYRNKHSCCEICGSTYRKQVHHIDRNRQNNKENNLLTVCLNCHTSLHKGWFLGKVAQLDTIIEIKYSGIKEVFDIEMKEPYNNFIANGFIVHNSTRYCNYAPGGKVGSLTFIIPPWLDIKEGEYDEFQCWFDMVYPQLNVVPCNLSAEKLWLGALANSAMQYNELSKIGWKPEQARSVLPNSLKSEIVITANAREWLHIFELRTATVAHPQMRELMVPLKKELIPLLFGQDITLSDKPSYEQLAQENVQLKKEIESLTPVTTFGGKY
jgi:thymidylate synthase ThyX